MLMQIDKPNITYQESNNGSTAKFVIEPLDNGFGNTIGNAMRRVLLGGMPGAAPVAIRIQGVAHAFSTISGVTEDVADIILNLKELIVKTQDTSPDFKSTIYLRAQGPCNVTAGDITLNDQVEVLNPDLHICTLADKASIDMEIIIGRGRGYVLADDNKDVCDSIGYIAIDSIFSPVKTVEYHVENARVGQNMHFDRLILDVETNGSLSAVDVTSLAAKLLNDHLHMFIELVEGMDDGETLKAKEKDATKKVLDTSIADLELSVRSTNCLKRASILTVGDLVSKTYKELSKVRNLGSKSLEEIIQKIESLGLSMKNDEE